MPTQETVMAAYWASLAWAVPCLLCAATSYLLGRLRRSRAMGTPELVVQCALMVGMMLALGGSLTAFTYPLLTPPVSRLGWQVWTTAVFVLLVMLRMWGSMIGWPPGSWLVLLLTLVNLIVALPVALMLGLLAG